MMFDHVLTFRRHTDQNPHRPDFMLAQGILTFSECGPDDGGLVVLEGSHHLHNQYHDERGGVNVAAREGRLNSCVGPLNV